MPWIDIASLVLALVALVAAVLGIWDVRKQVRELLTLQRNLLLAKTLNQVISDFVDSTGVNLRWDHLHQFCMVQEKLDSKFTLDDAQSAALHEALSLANALVEKGMATWKPGVDENKAREELKKWQNAKNDARTSLILGKKGMIS
jgi:hypothetical protein